MVTVIIKKVIQFCKNSKRIILIDDADSQWVSDGHAMYPMHDMPNFDMDSFLKTYDISAKKGEKISKKHITKEDLPLNLNDVSDNETPCELSSIRLVIDGTTYIQIHTESGCEFIDSKYLVPISDANDDMVQIFQRISSSGSPYFAVKDGLFLIALIQPAFVLNEKTFEELKSFVNRCDVHMRNKSG